MLLCLYCILVTLGRGRRRRRRRGDGSYGESREWVGQGRGGRLRQVRVWNDGVQPNLCPQKVRINEYLSGAKRFTAGIPITRGHAPRPPRVQAFCNHWSGIRTQDMLNDTMLCSALCSTSQFHNYNAVIPG